MRLVKHFGVQARNPLPLNETGFVTVTLTDTPRYFNGSRVPSGQNPSVSSKLFSNHLQTIASPHQRRPLRRILFRRVGVLADRVLLFEF
jgi:hypothetical protein